MQSILGAFGDADVPAAADLVDAVGLDDALGEHGHVCIFGGVGIILIGRDDLARLADADQLLAEFLEAGFDDEAEIAETVKIIHEQDIVLICHCGADGFAQRRDLLHGDLKRVVAGARVSIHHKWIERLHAIVTGDDGAAFFDLVRDG